MAMVALDAARRRIVETGSVEARWMVDEGDVADYIRDAARAPAMQARMEGEAAARAAQEAEAVASASEAEAAKEERRRTRR